jgi:hypothetical protein
MNKNLLATVSHGFPPIRQIQVPALDAVYPFLHMDSGIGGDETISPKCALTKEQANTARTLAWYPAHLSPWNERVTTCI